MSSLVLELQRDALNKNISAADLLRKALVVARKLKVNEIEAWITNELNGYSEGATVPDYRYLRGEAKVFNPYRGWIPLFMPDTQKAELLSKRGTSQSITELESLVKKDSDGTCYMRYPKRLEQQLMNSMEISMEPALLVSLSQIYGVIDKVRNTVLDWALKLEENGITGEGMSFSVKDKEQANSITYNIKNMIGSVQDSQIQQDTRNSNQTYSKALDLDSIKGVIQELSLRIEELKLDASARAELETEISCINSQIESPKPKVEVIKECLKSSRSIIEGAAGSALFQGIITALGTFT